MQVDLAVVGAGIVGLAHALAAARRGLRVTVLEREAACIGASIRNFGFVTVTGQQAGQVHARARRARDIWQEVCGPAGIPVLQSGLLVAAHSPEAEAVLSAFLRTEMGEGCELLAPAAARALCPPLEGDGLAAALWSPHERRVEARDAVPALARWLERAHGVAFRYRCPVLGILDLPECGVVERWTGIYAASPAHVALVDPPEPRIRIALVTSGTGMSTAFAIGEEVVADLFG